MRRRSNGRRIRPDRGPLHSRASCRLASAKARENLRRPHAVCKVRVGRRPDTGKGPFARSPQSTINDLEIRQWSIWSCEPSTFPWSYDEQETCLLVEGDVTVTPNS